MGVFLLTCWRCFNAVDPLELSEGCLCADCAAETREAKERPGGAVRARGAGRQGMDSRFAAPASSPANIKRLPGHAVDRVAGGYCLAGGLERGRR